MDSLTQKSVYVVISQTGTFLSRLLKIITHKEYNHASISLYDDLYIMYSFGRKHPYNPFYGGFVTESSSFGTFKRFSNTKVIVLKISLSEADFIKMRNRINYMSDHSQKYGYNYIGLCLAAFNIRFKPEKRYYCSEFVKEMLVNFNANGAAQLGPIPHPMDFLKLPECETVYMGKLTDYDLYNTVNFL